MIQINKLWFNTEIQDKKKSARWRIYEEYEEIHEEYEDLFFLFRNLRA